MVTYLKTEHKGNETNYFRIESKNGKLDIKVVSIKNGNKTIKRETSSIPLKSYVSLAKKFKSKIISAKTFNSVI